MEQKVSGFDFVFEGIFVTRFDIAILGDGLAGRVLAFTLLKKNPNLRIVSISAPIHYPACSVNSTSIVDHFVLNEGAGARAEQLAQAYSAFVDFRQKNNPDGIFDGHKSDVGAPSEKGLAHFIDPALLLNWLDRHAAREKKIELIKQLRPISDGVEILASRGEKFFASKIFLCLGAHQCDARKLFHRDFELTVPLDKIENSRKVPGNYLLWKNQDLGSTSWAISNAKANLIYRSWKQELLLGGTTNAEGVLAPNWSALKSYAAGFEGVPDFGRAELFTGVRHKMPGRMAHWGAWESTGAVFGVSGLYKNGFSLAFLVAAELAKQIE
jgi:hypothetical protein